MLSKVVYIYISKRSHFFSIQLNFRYLFCFIETIGGMLDLEPRLWRDPKKEPFEQQKKKVLSFGAMWRKFDITRKYESSSSSSSDYEWWKSRLDFFTDEIFFYGDPIRGHIVLLQTPEKYRNFPSEVLVFTVNHTYRSFIMIYD